MPEAWLSQTTAPRAFYRFIVHDAWIPWYETFEPNDSLNYFEYVDGGVPTGRRLQTVTNPVIPCQDRFIRALHTWECPEYRGFGHQESSTNAF